jgi:hypothetical protein
MSRRVLAYVFAAFLAACAHPPCAEETTVLLPVAPSNADVKSARVAFDTWLAAGRMPGARFRVLQVGATRADVRELLTVTIPRSFGTPAVANRNAFIARARELFERALRGSDAGTLGEHAAAAPSVVNLVTLPDHDSRGVRWAWGYAKGASHAAVICDVSPSTSGNGCSAASLTHAMDAWLSEAATGSFQVWIVGCSVDARRIFEVEVPEGGIAERAAVLLAARNELGRILDQPQPDAGSHIAGAIVVAVSDVASKRGSKRLFLLSDLRESAGPWSFDNAVPTPSTFIRWLAKERLLADCRGIRVTVCGVHFATTPGARGPFDARREYDIRSTWTASFQAMRAVSVEICDACGPDAFRSTEGGT